MVYYFFNVLNLDFDLWVDRFRLWKLREDMDCMICFVFRDFSRLGVRSGSELIGLF